MNADFKEQTEREILSLLQSKDSERESASLHGKASSFFHPEQEEIFLSPKALAPTDSTPPAKADPLTPSSERILLLNGSLQRSLNSLATENSELRKKLESVNSQLSAQREEASTFSLREAHQKEVVEILSKQVFDQRQQISFLQQQILLLEALSTELPPMEETFADCFQSPPPAATIKATPKRTPFWTPLVEEELPEGCSVEELDNDFVTPQLKRVQFREINPFLADDLEQQPPSRASPAIVLEAPPPVAECAAEREKNFSFLKAAIEIRDEIIEDLRSLVDVHRQDFDAEEEEKFLLIDRLLTTIEKFSDRQQLATADCVVDFRVAALMEQLVLAKKQLQRRRKGSLENSAPVDRLAEILELNSLSEQKAKGSQAVKAAASSADEKETEDLLQILTDHLSLVIDRNNQLIQQEKETSERFKALLAINQETQSAHKQWQALIKEGREREILLKERISELEAALLLLREREESPIQSPIADSTSLSNESFVFNDSALENALVQSNLNIERLKRVFYDRGDFTFLVAKFAARIGGNCSDRLQELLGQIASVKEKLKYLDFDRQSEEIKSLSETLRVLRDHASSKSDAIARIASDKDALEASYINQISALATRFSESNDRIVRYRRKIIKDGRIIRDLIYQKTFLAGIAFEFERCEGMMARLFANVSGSSLDAKGIAPLRSYFFTALALVRMLRVVAAGRPVQ